MRTLFIIILTLCCISNASARDVTLEWNPHTDPDLDHFNLYLAEKMLDSTGPWALGQTIPKTATTTTITVADDKHFAFYLTATDTSGNESGPSNTCNTSDRVPPYNPENLRIPEPPTP